MRTLVLRLSLALSLSIVPALAPSLVSAQDAVLDGSAETAMFNRLNELRAREGLPLLARDARLDAAARVHTEEMASRGELLHVSDATGTPIDRASAAGATDATDIAENVAMHFTLDDAQASLEASAAHLTNMLGPRATHVGLSAIVASNGIYVTQLFAHLDVPAAAVAVAPAPTDAAPLLGFDVPYDPSVGPVAPQPTTPDAAASGAVSGTVTSGTTVVVPPDPSGVVHVPSPAPGVTGYWICAPDARGGRWYYYPVRPGTTSGTLTPDLSVTGTPPGYGPTCSGGSVPSGSSTYGSSPPPSGYDPGLRPGYVTPPPSSGYAPGYAPGYGRGYVPGPSYAPPAGRVLITPWGSVRVETRRGRRRR